MADSIIRHPDSDLFPGRSRRLDPADINTYFIISLKDSRRKTTAVQALFLSTACSGRIYASLFKITVGGGYPAYFQDASTTSSTR